MKLSSLIVLPAAAAVLLTAVGSVTTVYILSRGNRVTALREQMNTVLREADAVAENMGRMHEARSFDMASLLEAAKKLSGDQPLKDTYCETGLYLTIPIVSAFQAAARAASEQGYRLSIPSRPGLVARNPRNDHGSDFAAAFEAFGAGSPEYFHHDEVKNELILARPVRLTATCLGCHGDPATSQTHDGLDPLGFRMEGLKVGEIKGAFVLKAALTADGSVGRTMRSMVIVSIMLLGVAVLGCHLFCGRLVDEPLGAAIADIVESSQRTANAWAQLSSATQTVAERAGGQVRCFTGGHEGVREGVLGHDQSQPEPRADRQGDGLD